MPSLLIDTVVDGTVNFTALSVLPRVGGGGGRAKTNGDSREFPLLPIAGSKDWLPSMVDVGQQETAMRELAKESKENRGDECDAPDAFFAVDLECVLHKYRRWQECFPRVKPFYAVKCNPNRAIVRVLATTPGCGFDCASPAEMDKVLECGVDPARIIYANPCKELAALEYALSAGIVTMTFDSRDELRKIRHLLDARGKQSSSCSKIDVQMVLRLRVPDDHSECPLGEKYGAVEDICSELIALAGELHLPLVGVSFHCGSGCQDAQAYPAALAVARVVFDLAARQGVTLTLLDIGGGFPGWDGSEYVYEKTASEAEVVGSSASAGKDSAPPLSLEKIAEVTIPVLDKLFPPSSGVKIIAEPGRYFVEASHVLFARIYAKRKLAVQAAGSAAGETNGHGGTTSGSHRGATRRTTAYFIDEGVYGCFKDRLLCDVDFEPCPVFLIPAAGGRASSMADHGLKNASNGAVEGDGDKDKDDNEEEEDAVVMGPSGLPADVVARKRLPKFLGPGDWLYFSRMGAYTTSIATVASSAILETPYRYVASAPAK